MSLFAQLEIESNYIEVTFDVNKSFVDAEIPINCGNEGVEFVWSVVQDENNPTNWGFYFCDLNNCHPIGKYEELDKVNVVKSNSKEKVSCHIQPKKTAGIGIYTLQLLAPESKELIDSVRVKFISETVSSKEVSYDKLNIYPNPVAESFKLNGALHNASEMVIYNILGKEIKSFDVEEDKVYDISTIERGRYFLRVFDQKGQSLKVLRLIKK